MAKGSEIKPLDLIVRNGTLLIPGVGQIKADVGIANGKIAVIGEDSEGTWRGNLRRHRAHGAARDFSTRTSTLAMNSPTKAKPRPKREPGDPRRRDQRRNFPA